MVLASKELLMESWEEQLEQTTFWKALRSQHCKHTEKHNPLIVPI